MSRVITFSRYFPAHHPKAGQPTFFVEKILRSRQLIDLSFLDIFIDINAFDNSTPKHHTIRAGKRWKVGDKFSPRIWSGNPYRSKMIIIAPDIEVKKIWDFDCDIKGVFYLNGKALDVTSSDLPMNDGLSDNDLLDWFPVGNPFSGQIICWNDKINY